MKYLLTLTLALALAVAQAPEHIARRGQMVCWDAKAGVVMLHENTAKKCKKAHDHWIVDRTGEMLPSGGKCANAGCTYLVYPAELSGDSQAVYQ